MRYAIIENGTVVNVTQGQKLDAAWVECGDEVGIGWTYSEASGFAAPPAPAIPTPIVIKPKLTRLEYLSRFTDAEAIGIDLASIGATVEAASIRRLLKLVDAAEFIDLDDPRVQGGVQMLETAGLIGAGRAAEILA